MFNNSYEFWLSAVKVANMRQLHDMMPLKEGEDEYKNAVIDRLIVLNEMAKEENNIELKQEIDNFAKEYFDIDNINYV